MPVALRRIDDCFSTPWRISEAALRAREKMTGLRGALYRDVPFWMDKCDADETLTFMAGALHTKSILLAVEVVPEPLVEKDATLDNPE